MTLSALLAAAAAPPVTSGHLNPVKLFLDADIVVQGVMAGLILASVWVWTIIVSFSLRSAALRRRCDGYEREFWQAGDIAAFQTAQGKSDIPSARVAAAGLAEWRRSTGTKSFDRAMSLEGTRQRLAAAMDSAIAQEAEKLAERLNFLATVGAVAPFVGLFGTVWGIMNSFYQIGQQQNSSLAVVAPGISEALFATAIGLVAAIPAMLAYNLIGTSLARFAGRLEGFGTEFGAILSRQTEERS